MKKYLFITLILAAFPILTAVNTHAQRAYGLSRIAYDPVSREIFGYSRTEVDYYAGAYYDPYVVGSLYGQFSRFRLDGGVDQGYQNYIPAEVFTSSNTTPLTRYDVVSDHYVISYYTFEPGYCDYYGYSQGCGYDPWGYGFLGGIWDGGFGDFWGPGNGYIVPNRMIYLGSTGISGITPPEDPCNSTYGDAYEYDGSSSTYRDTEYLPSAITACPSPTPTPNITAQVTEVGFRGDLEVKRFNHGNTPQDVYNPPDLHTPMWKRDKDPKYPVAYQKDQQPAMWAKLMLSPAPTSNVSARIQVKKDGAVIATKDVDLVGANVIIDGISVTSALENPTVVKGKTYKFTWEISFDNGSSWKPMGNTSHKIYWTYSTPLDPAFRDYFGDHTWSGLFDKALEHSAGEMGDGSNDVDEIIRRITVQQSDINYNPGHPSEHKNPLEYFEHRTTGAVCGDEAAILRGLLRSIGIDGQMLFYYGGNTSPKTHYFYYYEGHTFPKSFQIHKGARPPYIGADPHFSYHSVVKAGPSNFLYDPSYGERSLSIHFIETYCPTCTGPPKEHFAAGTSECDDYTVEDTTNLGPGTLFEVNCPHEDDRLTGANRIDDAQTYVAQQYYDLLGREPDAGGLGFWTSQITNCGSDSNCVAWMRVQVAKAFFLSREFRATGMYVYYLYKASYGRQPNLEELSTGQHSVGKDFIDGTPGCDTVLENNQAAFVDKWVDSDDFSAIFDELANDAYIDTLYSNIGVTPGSSERQSLLDGLNNGTQTRAQVLRYIINNSAFAAAEDHPGFVLLEYYGFLTRNPDDPPDSDMSGYNFWLGQFNTYNDQDSMISAFVTSTEYRARFGQP